MTLDFKHDTEERGDMRGFCSSKQEIRKIDCVPVGSKDWFIRVLEEVS